MRGLSFAAIRNFWLFFITILLEKENKMKFWEKYVRLEGRKVYHKGSARINVLGNRLTRCGVPVFSKGEVFDKRPHNTKLCKNCMGTRGE